MQISALCYPCLRIRLIREGSKVEFPFAHKQLEAKAYIGLKCYLYILIFISLKTITRKVSCHWGTLMRNLKRESIKSLDFVCSV